MTMTAAPTAAALALTLGEPAGIGPDITLLAWLRRKDAELPPFYVTGSAAFLRARAATLGLSIPIARCQPDDAASMFDQALPVFECGEAPSDQPGKPDAANAGLVIRSIETAVDHVERGHAAAVVTNPISKAVLTAGGFTHPGHTEFLGALAEQRHGQPFRAVMLLWSELLAVVPITIHMALSRVPSALTTDLIVETARITAQDYQRRFGIQAPRLAFCGLNPHAGENGLMGDEEERIIAPAIARLAAEGLHATGPYPADTLFHPEARATYDVAFGMYHDQVLVPLKTLAFDEGVNVTLGLPFVRTSPDHGTAFALAGTGAARPTSLIAALKLAGRMAGRR